MDGLVLGKFFMGLLNPIQICLLQKNEKKNQV